MSTGIPVDDPDFKYLGVDRKALLAEQKPFDGKKNCWCPDQKEGFLRAEIESTKGDMVTVRTEKMEVRVYCIVFNIREFTIGFLFITNIST